MKLVEMKCPSCGAKLNTEKGAKRDECQFCGTSFLIEDERQEPEPSVKNDTVREIPTVSTYVVFQQQPSAQPTKPQKRKTWLWVLGWIFIFPVPLTILMLRNEDLDKRIRYAIIAAAWVLFLCLAVYSNSVQSNKTDTPVSSSPTIVETANQ